MIDHVYKDPSEDGDWMFVAEDQTWDNETLEQLKEQYNIIFMSSGSGVMPIMCIERENENPLFVIGVEDDGCIYFERRHGTFRNAFDSAWTLSLVSDLVHARRSFAKYVDQK